MMRGPNPKPEHGFPAPDTGLAVALLSGGADSCVMAAEALRARRVFPLYVRQGALWEDAEEAAVRRFLAAIDPGGGRLGSLRITRLDLPDGYASRWALEPAVAAPDAASPDEAVYLPGRNLALLLQGALLAHGLGARAVLIGLLAGNPFPDSRPAFLRAFEAAYALATETAIHVETPLSAFDKAQVLRRGAELGLPLELSFSCLRPAGGRHCGHCNKCAERRRGFAAAGLNDPTEYS